MSNPFRAVKSHLLAAATVAAVVAVLGVGPAHAAAPTMRTGTAVTDDYALAEIYNLGFSRHGVLFMGGIWDRCGSDGRGDGAGAYIRGQVRFANGAWSAWSPWEGDSSGCHDAGTTFSHSFNFPDRTVTDLELRLCERDAGVIVECTTRTFDNPRVAG